MTRRTAYAACLLALAFTAPAHAQPAQQPPSPTEQALGAKLMTEINSELQCSANVITLQQQIMALQAKIKDLEQPRSEPAK